MAVTTKNRQVDKFTSRRLIGLGLAVALMLILANSAVWANQQLFNTQNFTRTATEAVTSESSRNAIAASLTEQIFAERPVALQVAGDTTTKLISGLLGTAQFESDIARLTSRLQTYVTSEDQQSVALNFEGLKDTIESLIQISGREDTAQINTERIPDEIVIVDESDFADYYSAGIFLLWVGPLALIAAVAGLIYPYIKRLADPVRIMVTQGVSLLFGGILALLIGPLFRPIFLSNIEGQHGRVVAENIYNGFIDTFNAQTMIIISLGMLTVVAAGIWHYLRMGRKRGLFTK